MADIFHNFSINASLQELFKGITTPEGLDSWWTRKSAGQPIVAPPIS